MSLVIDDSVSAAWGRLTSDSSTISWICCGYNAENGNKLELREEGDGGMPEFISKLAPDQIIWGAFKVVGVDDRGNTVSRRPKFICVKWLPETVPTMKRARAGGHKGAIKAILNAQIDVEISSVEELTEESIIAKLRAAGGAHAPTHYEFSAYSS